MSHPHDFTIHALQRCVERYGFLPVPEECAAVLEAIRTRRALLVHKTPPDPENPQGPCDVYLVELGGTRVRVAYDADSDQVVTILPLPDRQEAERRFGCGQPVEDKPRYLRGKLRPRRCPRPLARA